MSAMFSDNISSESILVKEEPEWGKDDKGECGVSEAVADLYTDHIIKDEMVLDSERLQPQDIVSSIQQSSNKTECSNNTVSNVEFELSKGKKSVVKKQSSCDICMKLFRDNYSLTRHKLIHTRITHNCNICKRKFKNISALHRHKFTHSGKQHYSCKVCGKQFLLKHYLTKHMLIHTREKRYSCEVCEEKFLFNSDLTKHKSVHTKEQLYTCEVYVY